MVAPGPVRAMFPSTTRWRTLAAGKYHHEAASDERRTGQRPSGLPAEDKGAHSFRRVAKEMLRRNLDAKMEE